MRHHPDGDPAAPYAEALADLADLPAEWATTVQVSAKRRTLGLTVDEHAHLTITVPAGTDPGWVARQVRKSKQWVYRKVREQAPYIPAHPVKELVGGESFPLLGRPHRLRIVPDGPPLRCDETTRLSSWSGSPIREIHLRADHTHDPRPLIEWYAERGAAHLNGTHPQSLAAWCNRWGITDPPRLVVSTLPPNTRFWGRYSARTNTLKIDWALFQLDRDLVEFVMLRELLKTPEMKAQFVPPTIAEAAQRADRLRRDGARAWIGDVVLR